MRLLHRATRRSPTSGSPPPCAGPGPRGFCSSQCPWQEPAQAGPMLVAGDIRACRQQPRRFRVWLGGTHRRVLNELAGTSLSRCVVYRGPARTVNALARTESNRPLSPQVQAAENMMRSDHGDVPGLATSQSDHRTVSEGRAAASGSSERNGASCRRGLEGYGRQAALVATTTTTNPSGVPRRFRTPDPIESGPEWRMENARTAQEVYA